MKVLALIGTGITTISHITEEAKGYICNCDKVLYLVNEPLLESYINRLAKATESLEPVYFKSKARAAAYENIAEHICNALESVNSLCVVIYGHPCFFATPGLLALSKFSNEEVKTIVCSAISALDCLYADFRFDPANGGMQVFDATEYLLYDKLIDNSTHIIIYQIGMVGNLGLPTNKVNLHAVYLIKKRLLKVYKNEKKAFIYEAAVYPHTKPKISEFHLNELEKQKFTSISTLYIPPDDVKRIPNAETLKLINIM